MRKHISALVLLMLASTGGIAQKITGVVSDKRTHEPLPYVHIGIAGKNLGVISRDDGSFEIDVSQAGRNDNLVFSIIGYETRRFPVDELSAGRRDVQLDPKIYELREVVIRPANAPVAKLGRYEPTKVTMGQSGLREFGFGGEWGLRINIPGKRYFIDDVRLHIRYNTVDSILFRINMYNIRNDVPGESLLRREIFMTAYKNKKWIIRNLVKENITIDQDFIVTFEVVRVWFSKHGENRVFFTYGKGYEEGRSYYRASSHDTWTIDQHPPATLFLTAEEY